MLDTERQRLTAEQQLAQAQRDVLTSLVQSLQSARRRLAIVNRRLAWNGLTLRGCRFLLAILLVLLVLFPVLEDMARPILLIAVIASVFVAGVVVVHPGRLRVRKAIALAVVQIGLTGLAVSVTENSFAYLCAVGLALATTAVLIGYCIYCVLRYVLQANYITRDQIYAGICVYLMLGFAFGCIYYLVGMLDPGLFRSEQREAAIRAIPI